MDVRRAGDLLYTITRVNMTNIQNRTLTTVIPAEQCRTYTATQVVYRRTLYALRYTHYIVLTLPTSHKFLDYINGQNKNNDNNMLYNAVSYQ